MQRGGAGVDHQHLARLDGPRGERSDPLALLDEFLVALAQGGSAPKGRAAAPP